MPMKEERLGQMKYNANIECMVKAFFMVIGENIWGIVIVKDYKYINI